MGNQDKKILDFIDDETGKYIIYHERIEFTDSTKLIPYKGQVSFLMKKNDIKISKNLSNIDVSEEK